jgi:hypothetical protein
MMDETPLIDKRTVGTRCHNLEPGAISVRPNAERLWFVVCSKQNATVAPN